MLQQLRAQIRRAILPVSDLGLSQQPQGALIFPDDVPPVLAVLSGLRKDTQQPTLVRVNADGTIAGSAVTQLVDVNGNAIGQSAGAPLFVTAATGYKPYTILTLFPTTAGVSNGQLGAAIDVSAFRNLLVIFNVTAASGANNTTMDIQGSIDGATNWVQLYNDVTHPGFSGTGISSGGLGPGCKSDIGSTGFGLGGAHAANLLTPFIRVLFNLAGGTITVGVTAVAS